MKSLTVFEVTDYVHYFFKKSLEDLNVMNERLIPIQ